MKNILVRLEPKALATRTLFFVNIAFTVAFVDTKKAFYVAENFS